MKKIITISILVILFICIGFILFNNRTVSTITLDINPSMKIHLNKNNKIKKIVLLNDDAKDVINDKLRGKTLGEFIDVVCDNLIDKGYVKDEHVEIILHTTGNIKSKDVKSKIQEDFNKKNVAVNVIIVDSISKEDIALANKYNISPAKASYIRTIVKDNENIKVDNLTDKSVSELSETKETGKYCNKGYILEGDFCLKEIRREKSTSGMVCPNNYREYNGICYEDTALLEKDDSYVCFPEFTLVGNKCVRTETVNATGNYSCTKGELFKKGDLWTIGIPDSEKMVCVDKSTGKAPTLRCLTINHTMINGKCAVGPKPTINGGCIEGDSLVNGGCYTIDDGDQLVCPNGNIYSKSQNAVPELCPDTLTYLKPKVDSYSCPSGYSLRDNKCIKEETVEPQKERYCPSGYTLINNEMCINYNKTTAKVNGMVCNGENTRLIGNSCVVYEIKEAMR